MTVATQIRPNQRKKIGRFSTWLARTLTRMAGWRFAGEPPALPKFVLVGAPHTSNWDFLALLALDYAFKLECVWMGKESIFRGPLAPLFRRLGGIPIDRSSRNNAVEQAAQAFDRSERMVMAISPEGTRKKTARWKTGFYYIALAAGVPISLAFVDFRHKMAGFGPLLQPSGDIRADMALIRDFYLNITGRHPQNVGAVTVTAEAGGSLKH
jgi:1-acyl-sn-glycerol-3-phosphate acyltransferase